jgi:hypothetical protein
MQIDVETGWTVDVEFSSLSKSEECQKESLISHSLIVILLVLLYVCISIVIWRLKAGVVEQEEMAIVRQRKSKHVSAATNKRTTIEEVLEAVFSFLSLSRLHSKDSSSPDYAGEDQYQFSRLNDQ